MFEVVLHKRNIFRIVHVKLSTKMLRKSTAAAKYFQFPNRRHGYENIHA